MARAWIPLVAAEAGALPRVCAKTGEPTDRILAMPARARAGWTWWLLPIGVLPFLAARHFAQEATILLPLSEWVVQRLERLRLARLVALLEMVAFAGLGAIGARRDALLAGAAFLTVAVLLRSMETILTVRAQLDPSARGVLLTGVHPAFRDAVDGIQRAAWAGPRQSAGLSDW